MVQARVVACVIVGIVAAAVAVLACDPPPQQAAVGCAKDTDCKGDRVCESGRCVNPSPAAAPAASALSVNVAAVQAPSKARIRLNTEPDGASVHEEGVEVCSSTPCDILYTGADADPGAQHVYTFARGGYRTATRSVRLSDSPVSVQMVATR
jgi:hypothetical protein